MSVQAGIWHLDKSPASRDVLALMSQTLAPYGPDGETISVHGHVGLLYRRFHTTSESRHEPQPYVSRKGVVITWDGRLDNRDQLILELGADLGGKTDIHVVSGAFDRWGTDCFGKFIGDWAISIWHPEANELLLARDYIGVKQLFYYATSHKVMWSSHLVALALCGDTLTLCEEYVAGYLTFYPLEHLTPYQEIRAVRAGSFLRIKTNDVIECDYAAFDPQFRVEYKSDAEYEEHYRYLFGQSVRRRMRTDSPILCDLSGGFDSSSITCMADYVTAHFGVETPRADTFTFCDPSEPNEEDSRYSRLVEEQRKREGHRVVVQDLGETLCFTTSEFRATPDLPRHEIAVALPEILRKGNYRVILSGFGGDEMNGQALDFRILIAGLLHQHRLGDAGKQLIAWSLETGIPFVQLLWQSGSILLPSTLRSAKRSVKQSEPWLNPELARKHGTLAQLLSASEGPRKWSPGVRDSYQTLNTLRRQLTNEPPSAAERRYPFLDADLSSFLLSIPLEQLLRPGERRRLMRRALHDIVPEQVLNRNTKDGAGRSIALTLSKHWEVLENVVASPLLADMGIIDTSCFGEALRAAKHGQIPPHIVSLLKTLTLELWLRDSIARGVVGASRSIPTDFKVEFVNAIAS